MKNISWVILKRKVDATEKMVDIEIVPECLEIRYFLSDVAIDRLPDLIDSRIKLLGFHNILYGLISYSELDGGDFAEGKVFEPGNVKIYHNMFNEVVVDEMEFNRMLLDYSEKILEVYGSSKEVNTDWRKNLEERMSLLKKIQ